MLRRIVVSVTLASVLAIGVACSAGDTDEGAPPPMPPGGSAGSGAGGLSSSEGGPTGTVRMPGSSGSTPQPPATIELPPPPSVGPMGGSGGMGGGSCSPTADQEGCVGVQYEGEVTGVDVHFLFDQSCSMSCDISRVGPLQCCRGNKNGRIVDVRKAVDLFVHDPRSLDIGFGLSYFGFMPSGKTSCDPEDYLKPAIPINDETADAIATSLNRAEPTGETPTGAAIRGACEYVRQSKRERPGRSTAIILVTDGIPETPNSQCGATLQDAVVAATECSMNTESPTKVYVLGVGGALDNLNQIAVAGRTERAFLVEGGDVAQSVLEALNAIRAAASIPCELEIPPPLPGERLDYAKVNLGVCDATGRPMPTYFVERINDCGPEGGWFYDNPTKPQSIILCDATCEAVSYPGALLNYAVGCQTQFPPR